MTARPKPDEQSSPPPSLRHVNLSDLMLAPVPAPRYVVQNLVPRGVVTHLGAHGGAGKSSLGLTIATHVAAGAHEWAGHRLEDGWALFVSLEDSGDIARHRLRNIVQAYGLDADKVARRLTIVDGTENPVLAFERSDMGERHIAWTSGYGELRKLAEGARLVVIDNASDAFDANENERRLVRAFVRGLARVAADNDAGLILLAHIDKNAARNGSQGNTYSGSTAWHNSARSRLALLADGDNIELRQEKANFGRKADPIHLEWSEHGVLMPVSRIRPEVGGDDAECVLAALRAAQTAGVDVGAARTGPATAQTVLATFDELPAHLKDKRGRARFWSAIGQLQSCGKVNVAEVVTGQRNRRKVLVCVSSDDVSLRALIPHTP